MIQNDSEAVLASRAAKAAFDARDEANEALYAAERARLMDAP